MGAWFGLILVTAFAAVGVVLILTAGSVGRRRPASAQDASKRGPA